MELGSLNMDVIFRAEQKERRDERANERTHADMGCGKNRGSGMAKEGRLEGKGFSGGWLDIIHPPLWRSGDPELK